MSERDEGFEDRTKLIRGYTPEEIESGYQTRRIGGRYETRGVPVEIQLLYELRQLRAEVRSLRELRGAG